MNTGFGQSCRGYVLLRYLGYPKVKILHGGYVAWTAAGMPTSTAVADARGQELPARSGRRGHPGRPAEHEGGGRRSRTSSSSTPATSTSGLPIRSSPYGKDFCPRKGRIPGAVWIEWYRMMKPTPNGPMFKSRDEILAECATVGVTPTTPVVLYCFKGARASNTLVALKEAGIENVTLYFGSWNEWSRDPSLPIETGLPYTTSAAPSVAA